MTFVANTRISVLGGTSTNEWGDEVDGTTVAASGIPASILQRTRVVTTPEMPTPRRIAYYVGRLPHGTPVGIENRIRDEVSGRIYAITDVDTPANVGIDGDLRLDLKRVT
ncbi:hypothetical protein [Streptomyces sp. NPDC096153]|uniref:hypothetical protein n=1 Tax=Streptomyces sp. NPDC096153 TaxID=3155548 RepID=UPI00332D54F7